MRNRLGSRYVDLVKALCRPGGEAEWVEYKLNNTNPQETGQYISALANSAALNDQPFGYLLWGGGGPYGQAGGHRLRPEHL